MNIHNTRRIYFVTEAGRNYAELLLLTHHLKYDADKPIQRWLTNTCSESNLKLSTLQGIYYTDHKDHIYAPWIYMNPDAQICDLPLIEEKLNAVSEERELEILKEEFNKQRKRRLEETVRIERGGTNTYTIAELKNLAKEESINIRGLTRRKDIAQRILDKI